MPQLLYATLLEKLKIFPCSLLTSEEEYQGTSKLLWKCNCGKEINSSWEELRRWKGKCETCRKENYKHKGGNRKIYTYDIVKKTFEEAECELLSPEKDYKNSRTTLLWKCKCGKETNSSFASFKNTKRCRVCGVKSYKGITVGDFNKLLKENNWKMVEKREEDSFIDTKEIIKVETENGKIHFTSYNRLQSGHKTTKEEADNSLKKDYEDVKLAFEEKYFELLEENYVNKSTPMKYKCSCGEIDYISYEGLKENTYGCNKKCLSSAKSKIKLLEIESDPRKYYESICSNMKDYIFPSGKRVQVQGYENWCIDDLLEEGIREDDIVVGTDKVPIISYKWKGTSRPYCPDILIPSQNKLIEVKSLSTINTRKDQNEQRWKGANLKGYILEVRLYFKISEFLIESGANTEVTNSEGKDFLYYIEDEGRKKELKEFAENRSIFPIKPVKK